MANSTAGTDISSPEAQAETALGSAQSGFSNAASDASESKSTLAYLYETESADNKTSQDRLGYLSRQ